MKSMKEPLKSKALERKYLGQLGKSVRLEVLNSLLLVCTLSLCLTSCCDGGRATDCGKNLREITGKKEMHVAYMKTKGV